LKKAAGEKKGDTVSKRVKVDEVNLQNEREMKRKKKREENKKASLQIQFGQKSVQAFLYKGVPKSKEHLQDQNTERQHTFRWLRKTSRN